MTLTDPGLTKREDGIIDKENLNLVVDGLEAACTDVGDQVTHLGYCGWF
ncbi:hypothetical protein [Desulforhopalus sp. 52FAK]